MGKLTKKEFADLTGLKVNHLATYCKRGSIYVEDDGMFNDANEVNKIFITKRVGFYEPKLDEPEPIPESISEPNIEPKKVTKKKTKLVKKVKKRKATKKSVVKKKVIIKKKPVVAKEVEEKKKATHVRKVSAPKTATQIESEKTEQAIRYKEAMLRFKTDKRKSELDIKIKEHTEVEKRMKNEKVRGEVIPTVLMKSLLGVYSDTTRQAYYDALDNYLIMISHKAKMSSADQSSIRKQINELINVADAKAIDEARKKLGIVVKEYSKTRGVGESV